MTYCEFKIQDVQNMPYLQPLLKLKHAYNQENNLTKKVELVKEAYAYIKTISFQFYDIENKVMNDNFSCLIENLSKFRSNFPPVYIIKNNPIFNLERPFKSFPDHNAEDILNALVKQTRIMLYKKINHNSKINKSLADLDLTNYCSLANLYITKLCKKYKIKNKSIKIEPGFQKNSLLFNGHGYHYVNIIDIEDKSYLIDCTYSQFFLLRDNILEQNGIPYYKTCYPGFYMLMTPERLQVVNKILTYGWIYLSDENLKNYLDGFTLSYRNGLYYEDTNDFSFTTNYDANDYHNFLKGQDNMLSYEPTRHLGFQTQPLNNPNLRFKKSN